MLFDADELYEPRIFVRGNPSQPGDRVPRQFLRVLAGAGRRPFTHGSGRLDLARAITAPDNPLTSRVIVNRVWMHHFGEPLVVDPQRLRHAQHAADPPGAARPPGGPAPGEGWSLKALHRSIMLSSTYQQSSFDRPDVPPG